MKMNWTNDDNNNNKQTHSEASEALLECQLGIELSFRATATAVVVLDNEMLAWTAQLGQMYIYRATKLQQRCLADNNGRYKSNTTWRGQHNDNMLAESDNSSADFRTNIWLSSS